MAKNDNLKDFLTDVANAIREKKGTTEPINPQDFSAEIAAIETGGETGGAVASVPAKDVNFRDYDGTILYSYTKSQFLALSALPELPTQPGLICQEWNWTLEDGKAHVQEYGVLEVGATYITDDGKTRLYISVPDGRQDVSLYYQQSKGYGVTIDWGDGSTSDSLSGTGYKNQKHHYDKGGDYVIKLELVSGATIGLGNATTYCVMGSIGASNNRVYCNMLKKVEFGNGVINPGDYAFSGCSSLSLITLPNSITSIGTNTFNACYSLSSITIPKDTGILSNSAFYNCNSLSSVSIPNSIYDFGTNAFSNCFPLSSIAIPKGASNIGNSAFSNCYSLTSVAIPKAETIIGDSTFSNCYSLTSVAIPKAIKQINSYAFSNCSGIVLYDFSLLTSVPTLSNKNAFNGIASDCKIIVPDKLYNTWINAANWSSLAANIQSDYTPTECVSLSITADNARAHKTTTTIYWEAITNGVNFRGELVQNQKVSGVATSDEFPANTSDQEINVTISFNYLGQTATTTITQGAVEPYYYDVNLNNQWQLSTIANPDATLYEGVYESFSNYNVGSGVATMYVEIFGYTEFTIYIRSYAEGTYDYVMVSQLDQTITGSTASTDAKVKAHTSGSQVSGTAITNYKEVKYENIDGGKHKITILYKKDGSGNQGTDKGYLLIKKE